MTSRSRSRPYLSTTTNRKEIHGFSKVCIQGDRHRAAGPCHDPCHQNGGEDEGIRSVTYAPFPVRPGDGSAVAICSDVALEKLLCGLVRSARAMGTGWDEWLPRARRRALCVAGRRGCDPLHVFELAHAPVEGEQAVELAFHIGELRVHIACQALLF